MESWKSPQTKINILTQQFFPIKTKLHKIWWRQCSKSKRNLANFARDLGSRPILKPIQTRAKLTQVETQPSSNPVKITDKALDRSFGILELVLGEKKRFLKCHLKLIKTETHIQFTQVMMKFEWFIKQLGITEEEYGKETYLRTY